MINIATVHHKTDKWIDIQLRYIRRHIKRPYRIYACVSCAKKDFSDMFFFVSSKKGTHTEKLNYLAHEIALRSRDDDMLIFMDGDTFPISDDLISFVREKIKRRSLVAVKRIENNGDMQPHPSFCATTVGFWRGICGNWNKGYCWRDIRGRKITDTGADLLKKLNDNHIDWYPLIRTNRNNLHPLWFGIYGGMVYHHGAGFRNPFSRIERDGSPLLNAMLTILQRRMRSAGILKRLLEFINRAIEIPWSRKNRRLSREIYSQICKDELFYLRFLT